MHTRVTRSASSEDIRSVARREVFGPGDGSEVWENGVAGNGSKRRPSAERCGTWEPGAGEVGGQATEVLDMLCPRKGEREREKTVVAASEAKRRLHDEVTALAGIQKALILF